MSFERQVMMDEGEVHAALANMENSRELLEIYIDNRPAAYAALVTEVPPKQAFTAGKAHFFHVSPLEPIQGNQEIREALKLRIQFPLENELWGGNTDFIRIAMIDGERVLRLGAPPVLRRMAGRRASRLPVPRDVKVQVQASMRSGLSATGLVVNLTEHGLSFECPSMATPFPLEHRIRLELYTPVLQEQGHIEVIGVVSQALRFRDLGKSGQSPEEQATDRYGVHLAALSFGQSSYLANLSTLLQRFDARRSRSRPDTDSAAAPTAKKSAKAPGAIPDDIFNDDVDLEELLKQWE